MQPKHEERQSPNGLWVLFPGLVELASDLWGRLLVRRMQSSSGMRAHHRRILLIALGLTTAALAATNGIPVSGQAAGIPLADTQVAVPAPDTTEHTAAQTISGASATPATTTPTTPATIAPATTAKPRVILELLPSAIAEDGGTTGGSVIRARLSAPSAADTTVTLTATPTSPATAADFTLSDATLTIPAGYTISTYASTITAVDDTTATTDKAITVSAAAVNASALGVNPPDPKVLTIIEDDSYTVTASAAEMTVLEGSTTAYTLTLGDAPTDDVTVTIAKAIGGDPDITLDTDTGTPGNQNTLTFMPSDYTTARTVTVAAAEDDGWAEGTATISHSVSSGDPNYNNLTTPGVIITEHENDEGIRISPTSLETPEGASTVYKAAMTKAPESDVTLTPSLQNATNGAFTVTPSAITFTPTDWSTERTITVSAASDDNQINGTATVSHAVTASDNYSEITTASSVSVTEIDSSTVGKQVTLTLTPAAISENSGSATVTAVLNETSIAATTVKIALTPTTGASERDFILSGDTLTCAAGDTTCTGTVTISAVNDGYDTADKTFTVTGTADNTAEAGGVSLTEATLTITDDDTAGLTAPGGTITETASAVQHRASFHLNSRPAAALTVTPSLQSDSDDSFSISINPSSGLTINPADNWADARFYTVTLAPDTDTVNGAATVGFAISNTTDTAYSSLSTPSATFTEKDKDTILVVSDSEVGVLEGTSAAYTVVMAEAPTETTVVTVTGAVAASTSTSTAVASTANTTTDTDLTVDTDPKTVGDQNTLTFTPSDWHVPQIVTVTADQDDDNAAGSRDFTHTITTPHTPGGSVVVRAVEIDDETAGAYADISDLAVPEGGSASYTLRLTGHRPISPVTVTLSAAGDGDITVDTDPSTAGYQNTLTFTPSDYTTARTVTVKAAQDDDAAVGIAQVIHTLSSSDKSYNLTLQAPVTLMEVDDDTAGLVVNPASRSILTSEGLLGSYTLKLGSRPAAAVRISMVKTSGDDDIAVASSSLTFTTDNWNTARIVRVTAAADKDSTAGRAVITNTATSTDLHYDGLIAAVTAVEADTTAAAVAISAADLDAPEAGSITYTAYLTKKPAGDVTVTLSTLGDGDINVDTDSGTPGYQNTLTFTPGNFSINQTITVTAKPDADDADGTATISATAISQDDPAYHGITIPSVAVTELDDDKAGIVLSPVSMLSPASLRIFEGSESRYLMRLSTAPTSDVKITMSLIGDDDIVIRPRALTFTADNWNTAQPVTVTAASDTDKSSGVAVIKHRAVTSDIRYSAAVLPVFTATEIDSERATPTPTPPQTPPPPPIQWVFDDISGNAHAVNIAKIAAAEFTRGCNINMYCPNESVTRAQMASFLKRAFKLPPATSSNFQDIAGNTHESTIRALEAAGITIGCTPTLYCPENPVTRAQMASFIVRALKLPPATSSDFQDIAGNTHESTIQSLAAVGITKGCTPTLYCPNKPITRSQMASFLARAFNL